MPLRSPKTQQVEKEHKQEKSSSTFESLDEMNRSILDEDGDEAECESTDVENETHTNDYDSLPSEMYPYTKLCCSDDINDGENEDQEPHDKPEETLYLLSRSNSHKETSSPYPNTVCLSHSNSKHGSCTPPLFTAPPSSPASSSSSFSPRLNALSSFPLSFLESDSDSVTFKHQCVDSSSQSPATVSPHKSMYSSFVSSFFSFSNAFNRKKTGSVLLP